MLKKTNPLIPKYAIKPLALALLVNSCVYMGIAQLRRFLTFSSLETPLDTALPFLAPFVLFYVLAFVQWGLNYLLIARDSKELCYRFAFGNIIAKLICLFFFVFFPTTLARPEVTGTDLCSRLVRLHLRPTGESVPIDPLPRELVLHPCFLSAQEVKPHLSGRHAHHVPGRVRVYAVYQAACDRRCIWRDRCV